jgi:flavin-dependent dehydrogenase
MGLNITRTISYRAHQVPFRYDNSAIQNSQIILIGDAAGLTDPLTGEGIYYALKSGLIAAESINDYFQGKTSDQPDFEQRINREIMPDLIAVDQLQQLFFRMLKYFHNQINTNERLWNAFVKVLEGEKEYQSFINIFGHFKVLFPLIYSIAKRLQDSKIKNFKEIKISG